MLTFYISANIIQSVERQNNQTTTSRKEQTIMRKNANQYERPEIREMVRYHRGNFERLVFFNSDRKINLNGDYTVSANNKPSTLTIVKAGQHLKGFGLEIETVGQPITLGETVYCNLLDLIFSKAGFDDDFFKIEEDCTVDGECITQVFA